MIDNQWYAITSSDTVKRGKLAGLRRFGENLLLFRDMKGKLGCVIDLCAHRGASLAKGCVSDGNIKCPFHGIEYDTSGKCVYIPSEGRNSAADFSRFNLKSYETREIGGIVFAWYGDGLPDHEPDCFDVVTDKILILAYFIPVDDENSIIALRFYNRITGVRFINKIIARIGSFANKVVERQDKRIVETQLPKASQLRMRENLVAADMPIIEYRSRRDKAISRA